MKLATILIALVALVSGCRPKTEYATVTDSWTRTGKMREQYQEALTVAVTFKSPEWRAAFAKKNAHDRGLDGSARDQLIAQAKADDAGPLEFQMIVTTWDRRENDLDRGKRSVWRIRLLNEQGMEIEPLEIVRDKRPDYIIRAEFPEMGQFARAYVARFPRDKVTDTNHLRLQMSSPRGGVSLVWVGK